MKQNENYSKYKFTIYSIRLNKFERQHFYEANNNNKNTEMLYFDFNLIFI